MAAQVLSGSGNVTYTNSTGQNIRLVINYLKNITATGTMSFQGVSVDLPPNQVYGKTLALRDNFGGGTGVSATQTMAAQTGGTATRTAVPLEIAIAAGETFSITHTDSTRIDGYNCIIIPEAG